MIKVCQSCGDGFEVASNENYKTLCKSCFVKSKKSEYENLRDEISRLTYENINLRYALNQREKDMTVDTELLKRLKQLCHPDKHNGSQLSTSVFSELNKFK